MVLLFWSLQCLWMTVTSAYLLLNLHFAQKIVFDWHLLCIIILYFHQCKLFFWKYSSVRKNHITGQSLWLRVSPLGPLYSKFEAVLLPKEALPGRCLKVEIIRYCAFTLSASWWTIKTMTKRTKQSKPFPIPWMPELVSQPRKSEWTKYWRVYRIPALSSFFYVPYASCSCISFWLWSEKDIVSFNTDMVDKYY